MLDLSTIFNYGYLLLKYIRNFPLWLLGGLAVISLMLIFLPFNIYIPDKIGWPFIAIITVVLFIFKTISDSINYYKAKKTFHLTPIFHQCYWSSYQQKNNLIVTQLIADLVVKNYTKDRNLKIHYNLS